MIYDYFLKNIFEILLLDHRFLDRKLIGILRNKQQKTITIESIRSKKKMKLIVKIKVFIDKNINKNSQENYKKSKQNVA